MSSLPESIGNLNNLEHLGLQYNQLTSLPESFCNLPEDCIFHIEDNSICEQSQMDCLYDWYGEDGQLSGQNCP